MQKELENLTRDYLKTLTLPKKRYKSPLAITFVGFPASGKSYIAYQIEKNLPFVVISENDLASFLSAYPDLFKKGWEAIFDLAKTSMSSLISSGVNCIFDANIKKFAERKSFRESIVNSGGDHLLIHVNTPQAVSFNRIQKRNKEILDGSLPGSIMNWDYFYYEINTTDFPRQEENAQVVQPLKKGELPRFLLRISKKLLEKETISQ